MPRNVLRGGGKTFKAEVLGLKELEKQFRSLQNAASSAEAMRVLGDAAAVIARRTRQNASAQRWPQRAIDSVFVYANLRGKVGPRMPKLAALVGIGKRSSMVEWRAGKYPKSERSKVAPGGRVAESLATMYEIGTSRMPARPAFRPAVTKSKSQIIEQVARGYADLIEQTVK